MRVVAAEKSHVQRLARLIQRLVDIDPGFQIAVDVDSAGDRLAELSKLPLDLPLYGALRAGGDWDLQRCPAIRVCNRPG